MSSSFDSEYIKTFTSFSGADIIPSITIGGKSHVIGNIQTISISTHRDTNPVRTLGRINPAGYVRGPRTIAGSLIFSIFDYSLVYTLTQELMKDPRYQSKYFNINFIDEMLPFNIDILFRNEFFCSSRMSILGVIIVNEGQVMSIEDIITENTMNYVAQEATPMRPIASSAFVLREGR